MREAVAEREARTPRVKGFVSIVVPCRNEELTIGEFVDWCWEGLRSAGAEGEVLIVDNSTDRSPEIAREHGARVLSVPERGLGRAYVAAIPHIRGDYVIMGDCDLTYDFRQLDGFLKALDDGAEFVMGTRLKGYDRARRHAHPAPVLRHAGDHVGPQPALPPALLRHPLRHAGDDAAGAAPHRHPVAGLGVRVGNGLEGGQAAAAHHRGARALPARPRGAREPPQARGLALAVEGGLGATSR